MFTVHEEDYLPEKVDNIVGLLRFVNINRSKCIVHIKELLFQIGNSN